MSHIDWTTPFERLQAQIKKLEAELRELKRERDMHFNEDGTIRFPELNPEDWEVFDQVGASNRACSKNGTVFDVLQASLYNSNNNYERANSLFRLESVDLVSLDVGPGEVQATITPFGKLVYMKWKEQS